jgi:4'-phosphopantetheinyl transferase
MRLTLAHLLKRDPRPLHFDYSESGKPLLPGQALAFNLAHSGELAILAVNLEHAIGVDIEYIQDKQVMAIAARYFSAAEQNYLAEQPESEKLNAFFAIWAKKEAVVKAIGTGIQQSLTSFTVPLSPSSDTIMIEGQSWCIRPLAIAADYASALATHPSIKNISIWQWVEGHFHEIGQKNTLL